MRLGILSFFFEKVGRYNSGNPYTDYMVFGFRVYRRYWSKVK